jgi:hypothetical protein
METMLEAALNYAKKGIPVFPCGDDKRPLTPHGFKDATTNPAVIKRRWTRWPDALIAIPTGPMSGIAVMDLDKKGGKNGFKAIPDWRKRSNVISRTMSKGAHLFYKDSGIPCTTGKIAPGVDTRGAGGYVIVPPSHGYKYLNGQAFDELWDWPADLRPPEHKATPPLPGGKRIKVFAPVDRETMTRALDVIPSDSYQVWFEVGCALYHEFGDDGFDFFESWSKKSAKYKAADVERKWAECEKISGYTFGSISHYADEADPKWRKELPIPEGATKEDFVANLAMHNYIYLPTNQSWPAASVNSRLGKQLLDGKRVSTSTWLDKCRAVQAITWSPGDPQLIRDRVIRDEGGWIEKKGDTTLNQYTPPTVNPGDANKAKRWVDLVHRLYPGRVDDVREADHILDWLAQRVQYPGIKINHALVLGGGQGIGKDTILNGIKLAVGPWNFAEASPKDITSRWNAWVKSVVLRINEARDLGEIDRYAFYDATKTIIAVTEGDTIPCEEKYMKRYAVPNVTGVVYTTNYKTGGIYLPEDDRRHFFAWSELVKENFSENFWKDLYAWYRSGGWGHITAYLHARDISKFDPKAAPPRTEAWRDVVEANLAIENQDFSRAIDMLSQIKGDTVIRPSVLSVRMIREAAIGTGGNFRGWLMDRKNARAIPYRMEECGYSPVRNPRTKLNSWKYRDAAGQRGEESLYGLKNLSQVQREAAGVALVEDFRKSEPKWLVALNKNRKL